MFGPFRKKPPDRGLPPTEKQVRFARRIGVSVLEGTTRDQLSRALDAAMKRDPSIARRMERIGEERDRRAAKKRAEHLGPEIIRQEQQWDDFAAEGVQLLAVYEHRNEWIVDVIQPFEAVVDEDKRRIRLAFHIPRRRRDRDIGEEILDWDDEKRPVSIPPKNFYYWEPVHDDLMFDIPRYSKLVKRGMKIAKAIKRGKQPPRTL